ncbi:hypothetical protein L227DRAFT_577122 [Lentinus tigrinus ALCF2SS1-6]|uniref:F-box domain-containing protein n=1 Tax=Lentinus tigrinus ALCF2SS1-6 TaxID=1328759 RepID=A0A5C2S469_9APHY|nr:hypothetical protein L227DRAFT_577122 [Lentinus tigrinus ALCF2SS1-6]
MSDPQLSPMEIVDDQFNHNDSIGGTKLDLTIEDQRVLQAFSLPEGQQWMLSSIAYHREYARTLCSMYNATATIHRYLPPELLMEIFGWIRPENFGELRLLGVSRVWRDLLLRTAEFWVDMLRSTFPPTKRLTSSHPNFDPESGWHRCYTMSLERSAPRDIFLTYTGFTELAFTALSPHTQRIASLSVELYPQNAQHLFRLLRFELPRLETLNVLHAHVAGQHAEELGGGTLPQLPQSSDHVDLPFLHVLHIPSVLCTSISAGNLRSLTIGCSSCNMCAEARRPSLDDILSFLRRCPALTSLRFLKTSEPARSRRHTEKGPMSLNQLHELIFEDVSASWASDILRRLTLPFHTVVKFRDLGTSRIPQRIKTLPAIHASDRLALEFRKDGGGPIICEADASIGDTSFVNVQVAVNTQNPADHDSRIRRVCVRVGFSQAAAVVDPNIVAQDRQDAHNPAARELPLHHPAHLEASDPERPVPSPPNAHVCGGAHLRWPRAPHRPLEIGLTVRRDHLPRGLQLDLVDTRVPSLARESVAQVRFQVRGVEAGRPTLRCGG